jgi:hypothetical protein
LLRLDARVDPMNTATLTRNAPKLAREDVSALGAVMLEVIAAHDAFAATLRRLGWDDEMLEPLRSGYIMVSDQIDAKLEAERAART